MNEKLGKTSIPIFISAIEIVTINFFRIQIDYHMLSDTLKDKEEKDEIKKTADKLLNAIKNLQETLTKIQAPNMKVPY